MSTLWRKSEGHGGTAGLYNPLLALHELRLRTAVAVNSMSPRQGAYDNAKLCVIASACLPGMPPHLRVAHLTPHHHCPCIPPFSTQDQASFSEEAYAFLNNVGYSLLKISLNFVLNRVWRACRPLLTQAFV